MVSCVGAHAVAGKNQAFKRFVLPALLTFYSFLQFACNADKLQLHGFPAATLE